MKSSYLLRWIARQTWLRVGAVLLVTIGMLMVMFAPKTPVEAQSSTPLCGGQCVHETVSFETGDMSINRIDVVFLLDVSGSMGDELDVVKEEALNIMDDLRGLVPDSAFGVASFVDYNDFTDRGGSYDELYGSDDDYAYRLDQDITESAGDVENALDDIILEFGEDTPESYNRALWEMLFLDWREDSKRIVIVFGDAFGHERDWFSDDDYGVDPGPDEIADTEDDLFIEEVVQQLADEQISIIGVNSNDGTNNATDYFEFVSDETGGAYFPLDDASEIPDAVVDLIEAEISTIDLLTVRTSAGYEDWIVVSPESYADVGAHESHSFEVDVCPVAGRARGGTHSFDLVVDGDGAALETIPISIDYSPRCTSGPEVYMGDRPGDDGSVCSNLNGEPFWESEDIVVRNEDDDIYYHQNPQYGQPNYIYARIHNIGDMDATQVNVTLYWGDPALGLWWPSSWNQITTTTIDVPVGESGWTDAIPWQPPGPGHYCLLARIESAQDPVTREGDVACDNNLAQRNLHILDLDAEQTISSDEVKVILVGPPEDKMGVIDIVIAHPAVPTGTQIWLVLPPDLLGRWQEAEGSGIDGGRVEGDRVVADPGATETVLRDVPLEPLEEREVTLHVEAPTADRFSVTVIERVDGQDVGGNVYYYVPPGQEPTPEPAGGAGEGGGLAGGLLSGNRSVIAGVGLALCCAGVFIAAIVIGAVLMLRRGNQPPPPPAYQ